MSAEKSDFVWHARDILTAATILDVRPIGWGWQDEVGLSEAEMKAQGNAVRLSSRKFWGFDPITVEDVRGAKWSFNKAQSKTDVIPKPIMSLGSYPAVTPECREVLEQADLGETDFLQIEVWDIPRKTLIFPELYLLHVRNAKQSLDIEGEVERGIIRENPGLAGSFSIGPGKTPSILPSALDGPDLWRESLVVQSRGNSFFLSDHLRELLRKAKMDKAWALHKAEVLQTH